MSSAVPLLLYFQMKIQTTEDTELEAAGLGFEPGSAWFQSLILFTVPPVTSNLHL